MKRMILIILCAMAVVPFLWAMIASLRPDADLFAGASLIPRRWTLEHYRALFSSRDFLVPIRNSLVVAGSTTILCLFVGAPAAYAVERLRFKGRRVVLGCILAIGVFPQISIVTPLFLLLRELRLIDTFPGLVLPYTTFALPLCVWLLVTYFREIPLDLEDAARIDGASRAAAFRWIVLPLAAPGLAATAILTFVYCWNEFLFAMSFTLSPDRQTVPVAIALFRGRYQVPWGEILAAAIVATLPVAVLVLLFQRRIVQGLTAGATKG